MRLLLAILILATISACSKRQGSGTSTDIGGGGSGGQAVWRQTADELANDLRVLISPSNFDSVLLEKLRTQLPEKIRTAKIAFKDYPLILGVETSDQDNPANLIFKPFTDCFDIQSAGDSRERDAINFPSRDLIKVSRVRFSCYASDSDRLRRLVLHEYLGLLGVADSDYANSSALLAAFQNIHRFKDGLEVHYLRTCEELEDAGKDGAIDGEGLQASVPVLTYRLGSDIDCSGREFRKRNGQFKHKSLQANLDGSGYAIRGLKLTHDWEADGRASVAIFDSNCTHCVIANLRIERAEIYGDAGLLLRNAGTIRNVDFTGKVFPVFGKFQGVRDFREAAGFVKENMGFIENARLEIEIGTPAASFLIPQSKWTGGAVGSNFGSIRSVHAKTTVYGSGYLGGFVSGNWGSISEVDLKTTIRGGLLVAAGGLTGLNRGRIFAVNVNGSIGVSAQGNMGDFVQVGSRVNELPRAGRLIGMISDILAERIVGEVPVPFAFQIDKANAQVGVCQGDASSFPSGRSIPVDLNVPVIGRAGFALPSCPELP